MMRHYSFLLVLLCNIVTTGIWAQTDSTNTKPEDLERYRPLGDTNQVFYYYLNNPDALCSIDTSLRDLEYVNPTWDDRWWGSHDLGNMGNPLVPVLFGVQPRGGFWIGLEQFSGYRLQREQIKYYQVTRNLPFTDLYYSQLNQKNALVRATFAHKITPQFYYSLNYNIVNHVGYFKHQKSRNQNIAFSGAYRSKFGKYRFYLDILHNAVKLEDNGGVADDDGVSGTSTLFLQNLETQSLTAQTEYKHTEISYQHYLYNLRGDSAKWESPATMEFGHRIAFQFNKYKYFDKSPAADFYGDFLVNERGIRYLIRHQFLENELSYRQALGGSLQRAPLWLRVSVLHRWNWGHQEEHRISRQQLGATLTVRSNPRLALHYIANGQLLWVQGRGIDFWAQGKLGYNFKRFGDIQAHALFQRYSPSQVAEQWYLSNDTIWQRDFFQIQTLSIGGRYDWQAFKWMDLSLQFNNHTLTNWVYADSMGLSQQTLSSINLMQASLRLRLSLWKFGIEAEGTWQRALVGGQYLRLPEWYLVGKLYFESKLFKSLRLRVGANVRWWSNYDGYGYLPYTGQFYLQQQRPLTFYPVVDFYVTFRVWRFRFFVNAENLTQLITQQNYFNALHYPSPNFLVRLGVSWRIFD
jgi:hypothetical protein